MSFNDFNSRREFIARQDYTRAVVQKRDLLARRIKGDDKKNDLDINKVIAEINNGNLAVLEELDKAGIAYTLTDNSQAFDGKSNSQTVTFKVGETTYTATYEGKTKEQEEAEKKQKAKGRARLESFLNSYENANTKKRKDNTSSNTTSVASQTQPIQDDKPVVAPKPEGSATSAETVSTSAETPTSNAFAEPTTNTNSNITVPVDKEKAEALLQELKNKIQNANAKVYVDHGITNVEHDKALAFVNTFAPKMTEIFMTKYGYNQEFAQILTDAINEKSFWDNYDRVGVTNGYERADDNTISKYDTKKILQSITVYMDDTDNLVYHNDKENSALDFGRIMTYHNICYKHKYYVSDYDHCRCVASEGKEFQNNDFKILDTLVQEFYKSFGPNISKEKLWNKLDFNYVNY